LKKLKRLIYLYKCFLFFGILLLISCGGGKPSGVLSEEKMKTVLWDVALAGEYANGYVYYKNPRQNRAEINEALLNEILKIHKVSKKEFDKSLEYYKQKPKMMVAILDSITTMQKKQEEKPSLLPTDIQRPALPLRQPVLRPERRDSSSAHPREIIDL
jgi:hypothetical protein